jgi:hypothetical protein
MERVTNLGACPVRASATSFAGWNHHFIATAPLLLRHSLEEAAPRATDSAAYSNL